MGCLAEFAVFFIFVIADWRLTLSAQRRPHVGHSWDCLVGGNGSLSLATRPHIVVGCVVAMLWCVVVVIGVFVGCRYGYWCFIVRVVVLVRGPGSGSSNDSVCVVPISGD